MSEREDLLPSGATELERVLARLSARIEDIDPSIIETIWDAWRCPVQHLPRLASDLSVDFWRDDWSEAQKRQVIANSPEYHAIKGTPRAIEIALSFLGYTVRVVNWAEMQPPRRRGTFVIRILIGPEENAAALFDAVQIADIKEAIRRAKPKSRGFAIQIGVGFETRTVAWAKGRTVAASRMAGEGGRQTTFPTPVVAWARARHIAISRITGA